MKSAPITDIASQRRARVRQGPTPSAARVADFVRTQIARVPAWFTAAQALRVAQLKGVDHVLVEQHGRLQGSVSRDVLALAPSHDLCARWFTRSEATVEPSTSAAAAEQLLRRAGASCLPVVSGGLLIGTISDSDLSLGDDSTSHAA
jgi:Mg/Co/Ni transporter MgtE